MAIRYTKKEELWNVWSHAGGILLGVAMAVVFLVWVFQGGGGWDRASVILYIVGMLGSYVASTAYHATPMRSKWRERLRRWDHAAIYWHIAGSYSPITLIALRHEGYWGWGLFCFVWLCAIVGTVMSTAAVVWIVAEGVCYITGAVFYSLNKRRYMHSVFHFFVLAGSVCHIIAVGDVLLAALS